jgi:hypothetical protein
MIKDYYTSVDRTEEILLCTSADGTLDVHWMRDGYDVLVWKLDNERLPLCAPTGSLPELLLKHNVSDVDISSRLRRAIKNQQLTLFQHDPVDVDFLSGEDTPGEFVL